MPALQGSPAQPVPKAGLSLETSDCSPWVLCRAGISTLPFFWAALICGKPGPAYQRTAAYLHTCCAHKIIRCVPLSFAYAVRAPRANLQPQQDWWTGHNTGPENHPSSSSFPLLIFWAMSWKFSLSFDLIYFSHLCFNCCAGMKDFLFPLSRYFLTREARKMTKGKKN